MVSSAPTLRLGRGALGGSALAWVALPVAGVLLIYWPTVQALTSLWASTEDYGHGFLIAPIVAFLVWRKRRVLEAMPLVPFWGAVVLCLGASMGWLVAHVTSIQVGMELALLAAMMATLWATLGWDRMKWLLFPVGYLIFAIPVWALVVPPLQELTADVSTRGVRWLGIPVYREGPFLTIPHGRFEIAEVCAGLRFLLASMSIAALYGYLNFDNLGRRVLFFALAVLWSILFNWVRVVVVIWLGHTLGMDSPIVEDHNSVGWVLFAASLVPLFIVGHFLQTPGESSEAGTGEVHGADRGEPLRRRYAALGAGGIALLAVSAGPGAAAYLASAGPSSRGLAPLTLPAEMGEWRRVDSAFDWQPRYAGADAVDRVTYAGDRGRVGLYVARYTAQAQDRELVSDVNAPFDHEKWSVREREPVVWAVGGQPVEASRLVLRGAGGREREVQLLYVIGGRATSAPLRAKLYQLLGVLRGRTEAAVVVLGSESAAGIGTASAIGSAVAEVLLGSDRD